MKRSIKWLCLALLVLTFNQGYAQEAGIKSDRKEKIEAMRVAFMTSRMNLTTEESKKFWPLYEEYKTELEKTEKPLKEPGVKLEDMSDQALRDLINKELNNEALKVDIRKKYSDKFLQVLSPLKLVRMHQAEKDFKLELLRVIQERRGN